MPRPRKAGTGFSRKPSGSAIVALLLALGAATACGVSRSAPRSAPESEPTPEPEIEALYWARLDSARARFTEADVRFMTGMIVHHAQAIEMGRMAPSHGAGPSVRTLAARIINAQKDEIATMERWLRDRDQRVPEVRRAEHGAHAEHDAHTGHGSHAGMPGMLTPEQMRELDAARGQEFDRLFLAYMIQHHRGALTMVDELLTTDGAAQDPATFKLASEIHVDQVTEIARMERMLAGVPGGGRGDRS